MSESTRAAPFEQWPRWAVAALLTATVALIILGYTHAPLRSPVDAAIASGTQGYTDPDLYLEIADRVRAGEPYHQAAVEVQAARDYPTSPFVTVRPPALTYLTAALGGITELRILIGALWATVIVAGLLRFGRGSRLELWVGSIVLALGTASAVMGESPTLHESWAGLLVALGLLLWRPDRWWPTVALLTLAALTRELAVPALVLLGAVAVWQRRWREAAAVAVATLGVGVCLVVHAILVTQAADALASSESSPGWLTFNGWPNTLRTVWRTALLPYAVTVVVVPLGLLGWLAAATRGDQAAVRVAAFVTCFAAVLTVVGQPFNEYWGRLFSGLLAAGIAFAPAGLWGAVRRLGLDVRPARRRHRPDGLD